MENMNMATTILIVVVDYGAGVHNLDISYACGHDVGQCY